MAEINRYNNSKIYKICSNLTDKIYIGSTTQTLAQRLSKHTSNYKQYLKNNTKYITSIEIIKLGDSFIVLLEDCNFNNQQQLFKREGEIIKLNINNVVNTHIAGRTMTEYHIDNAEHIAEYKKQYRFNNAEHLAEKQKQYRFNNAEHIAEYHKEYNIINVEHLAEKKKQYKLNNAEHIAEQNKQYRFNNAEHIAEKQKQTFTCNCGLILCFGAKSKHNKTKKHINLLFLNELTFYNL